MKNRQRYIAILDLLRKNTFQSRDEYYRNSAKLYENGGIEVTMQYIDLNNLERLGFVSVDRVGRGRQTRIVSVRLTEKGLFETVKSEMLGVIKKARIALPKQPKRSKCAKEKPMPCGQVLHRCYMSGCYLAYKCPLKQQETIA